MISERALKKLSFLLSPEHFTTRLEDLTTFGTHATKLRFMPDAVAFPGAREEISRILFTKPGVWENEIEAEFADDFIRQRAQFAYLPIIASGANACCLHYTANSAMCRAGELLLLDVAAARANYNSDLTRTIPVNGRFTRRQRRVYNAVLRVLRRCIQILRPGIKWKECRSRPSNGSRRSWWIWA